MEGTLEEKRTPSSDGAFSSFNPSIHGRYSGREGTGNAERAKQAFQSIYSWKVLWKLNLIVHHHPLRTVSIHLFMEGTLEVKGFQILPVIVSSFNPSIHGRYFGRLFGGLALPTCSLSFNPSIHGRYFGRSYCSSNGR